MRLREDGVPKFRACQMSPVRTILGFIAMKMSVLLKGTASALPQEFSLATRL
jgi:hypothetical protein